MFKALTLLTTLFFSNASFSMAKKDLSDDFKNYDGCFILYHLNEQKVVSEYNPNNRCNERLAPNSTFKIVLSLLAFNEKLIDQDTVFKWDGKIGEIPGWNQDHNPASWMKHSVVWVSQDLSQQLGETRMKHYLAGLDYGNQDFSGDEGANNGMTHAWLASSLKISAYEQLAFLKKMLSNQLPLSHDAINDTKKIMYLGKLDNGADFYGKTGSGRHGRNERLPNPSKLRAGWFVGFVEQGNQQYIFVSNLSDKVVPLPNDKAYGSQLLKPITLKILNEYFVG